MNFDLKKKNTFFEFVETLRKLPPTSGTILRRATKEHKVPNTNFTIPIGMSVMIPNYAIQTDPDVYEEPEKFDPNRFTQDQIQSRHACAFLSFGNGPRNCIGMRFAMLQTRIAIVKLLQNFEFSICSRTQIPLKFSSKSLFLSPEDGNWLKIKKIL